VMFMSARQIDCDGRTDAIGNEINEQSAAVTSSNVPRRIARSKQNESV
jgi:hypothetical protein